MASSESSASAFVKTLEFKGLKFAIYSLILFTVYKTQLHAMLCRITMLAQHSSASVGCRRELTVEDGRGLGATARNLAW
jgi:hypothetical protein